MTVLIKPLALLPVLVERDKRSQRLSRDLGQSNAR